MIAKLRPRLTRNVLLVMFGVLALVVLVPIAVHAQDAPAAVLDAADNAAVAKAASSTGGIGSTIVGYFLQLVGELVKLVMKLMGFILLLLVKALVEVAQYSNFVAPGPTAVRIGWIVTRDLANMFFIVVLLISAFSTIIGYSKYRYDAVLPRLLITAVMINFSKTIVGLLIDFSQVIMLTFVNGFAPAAGGNFLNAFQVNKLLALSADVAPISLDTVGLLLGLFFAVIMVTVAVTVVLLLTIHLVARVVNLWVLIIMAPIAFIAKIIPGLDSMYGEWWKKLTTLLISGPKIAFFIWLALITAQQSGGAVSNNDGFVQQTSAASAQEIASAQAATPGIPTAAATSDTILSMIIMIAILMAGLSEAQGAVNSDPLAKFVKGKLQSAGKFVQRETVNRAGGAALRGGGGVLARVPVVGGLGRAAVLRGEAIRASRTSAIEKFSGKPEDIARLSPEAFKRIAKGATGKDADKYASVALADKKMQANLKSEAKADLAKEITKREKDLGRPLTEDEKKGVKTRSTLDIMAENLKKAKDKDPNDGAKLGDLQSKFWQQLTAPNSDERKKALSKVAVTDMDKSAVVAAGADLSDRKAKELLESENPEHRNAMLDLMKSMNKPDELKKQLDTWKLDATKIPKEFYDETKAGKDTVRTVAGYALDSSRGDGRKLGELMSDPQVATQIKTIATERVTQAIASPPGTANRETKVASAVVDGINTGAITSAIIQGSEGIKNALKSSQLKVGDMAKHAEGYTPEQTSAAKAAVAVHLANNPPEKEKNHRKNPAFSDVMPSVEEVRVLRPTSGPNAPAPERTPAPQRPAAPVQLAPPAPTPPPPPPTPPTGGTTT